MAKTATIALSLLTSMIVPQTTSKPLTEGNEPKSHCNSLFINYLYYTLDEQINITGMPADLTVHWKTGNIYFTLINQKQSLSLNLLRPTGEVESIDIKGLGQSAAVDNYNDIIYLATDNGVYKYKDGASVELFTADGEDVMYVSVTTDGSTLYIATWPQNRVQKITNEGRKRTAFPNIPNGHGLTIDTRNNIYFIATKTTYILKNGDTTPIKIYGLPNDEMSGVFVSKFEDVYAMDENSNLYQIDPNNASVKKLGNFNIKGVNSFAMDSADNILIGVHNAILKYKVFERNPCPA